MNRYSKGQIYKIVDVGYNKMYIGSTCEDLKKRFERHRNCYNAYNDGRQKSSMTSFLLFDEFGVENCKIEWIENYPCNSKKELEAREGQLQQENDCVNKNIAGRTVKQYRIDNKERLNEICRNYNKEHKQELKEYVERNKEYFKQKAKEYYQREKECINEKHREQYQNNKEATRARHKKNYWENRDKVLANQAIKITCGCGRVCGKGDKSKHERTNKHQEWLKQQEQE